MRCKVDNRGVILLSVLWIVLILSVTSLSLATAARTQMFATGNDFDSARAFFMARGAAETMFYRMEQDGDVLSGSPVERDGNEWIFPLETGEVRVRLETGRSRIDINRASDELLVSMFDSLDVETETRNRLVDSILDWRDADDLPNVYGAEIFDYDQMEGRRLPANGSFGSVDELLLVNGMTTDLFFGRLVQAAGGGYRRIRGVQDLITVRSGMGAVNPNEASVEVLTALPQVSRELAEQIVELRNEEWFEGVPDLVARIPSMNGSDALAFMNFDGGVAAAIVARAEVRPSGVSRTVRIVLRQESRLETLSYVPPLIHRVVQYTVLDRWQYE